MLIQKKFRIRFLTTTLCSLILLTQALMASTLSVFSSEQAFIAAASPITTETFDEFPTPFNIYMPEVVIGGVQYDVPASGPSNPYWQVGIHLGIPVTPPNDFGSSNPDHSELSFGQNQYAQALGFYFLANAAVPPASWSVLVTELDGQQTTLTLDAVYGQATQHYFGLVSSQGIERVNVFNINRFDDENFSFDNVSHSSILASPVPEPPLWSVMGLVTIAICLRANKDGSHKKTKYGAL